MILNWNNNLFYDYFFRENNKVIGKDIYVFCRYKGKYIIIDGLCLEIRSKKKGLLRSSISIYKRDKKRKYYVNFPIFLYGVFNYNISGVTYGYKINFSRLSILRYKK